MLTKGRFAGTLVLIGAVLVPAVCFADSLEDVEKQIKDAYGKLKSYSASLKSETDYDQGGTKLNMTMTGNFEAKNGEEGKRMYRMEGSTKTTIDGNEHPGMGAQDLLVVCDGEFTYQLHTAMGQKQAAKTKADADALPWAEQKDDYEFKVLDSEKVDGEDAFVVEATPKNPGAAGAAKTVYYVRKDIGTLVKQVAYDKDGKVLNTTTFSDVKVNPDIPDDHFKFQAPEGVEVVDRTAEK